MGHQLVLSQLLGHYATKSMLVKYSSLLLIATTFFVLYATSRLGTVVIDEVIANNKSTSAATDDPILILHWNRAYDKYIFENEDLAKCPGEVSVMCEVTTDRRRALEADVITFHGMHSMMQPRKLTSLRKASDATFVFHVREPPTLTKNLGNWSLDFFDATMTYRTDSTILNTLYEVVPIKDIPINETLGARWKRPEFNHKVGKSKFGRKTKMAAWLVSKCVTPGRRERYVQELQRWMWIEVFGKCGQSTEPRVDADSNLGIYAKLLQPYFFYLSFENARCKNYISEKFYSVLSTQAAIPVVLGPSKAEYEAVAPPHSFIHVSDFKNARSLAKYLKHLSQNATSYEEYFWWTKFYVVRKTERICSTCERLARIRSGQLATQRIKDFNGFWVDDAKCNEPATSPWGLLREET